MIPLVGDGGFNMLVGEFLTAVHHHLPVKIVIFDNAAFGLVTLEAESVGILPFREAIDFPNPDYAALARLRRAGFHGERSSVARGDFDRSVRVPRPRYRRVQRRG